MPTAPSSPAPTAQPSVNINLRDGASYTCHRHIVTFMKECLAIMEQLAEEHDEAFDKLQEALPAAYHPYLALADHFTQDKEDRIRRAILQRGNDCDRAIKDELSKYQLDFLHQDQDAGSSDEPR